jgi:hypothetical protein
MIYLVPDKQLHWNTIITMSEFVGHCALDKSFRFVSVVHSQSGYVRRQYYAYIPSSNTFSQRVVTVGQNMLQGMCE